MYEKKVILTRFLHHFLQKMHIRQKYQTTGTTQQQLKTIVVLGVSHAKGANGANGLSRKMKWMGQFLNFFWFSWDAWDKWDKNGKFLFNLTKLHLAVSQSLLAQELLGCAWGWWGATLKIEWMRDCFATPAEWKLKRYALKL